MGVYVDKIVGYAVDVKEEWDKLLENDEDDLIRDRWDGFIDEGDNSQFKYPELFKLYTELKKPVAITLVNDGMNGDYTKLVYVIGFARDSVENERELLDPLNKELAQVKVDDSILTALKTVYLEIFNCELDTNRVHLELFNYFH